jgi:hypothetical protein
VQRNDGKAIINILGGPTELAFSRDEAQDRVERELFAQNYQEMHRLGREADGSVTLYIGPENWPFPIPLVENNGAWHFDSETASREFLFRRIGENELTAIAICHEFVAAEKHFRARPNAGDLLESSPASLVAKAANESGGGDPVLFHGYYFRVLETRPTNGTRRGNEGNTAGAFVLIAYPAEYRSSGVMTLIVTQNNIVYEKDLGANTSALARAMAAFHKDETWRPADK